MKTETHKLFKDPEGRWVVKPLGNPAGQMIFKSKQAAEVYLASRGEATRVTPHLTAKEQDHVRVSSRKAKMSQGTEASGPDINITEDEPSGTESPLMHTQLRKPADLYPVVGLVVLLAIAVFASPTITFLAIGAAVLCFAIATVTKTIVEKN